ncbi:hypothetical protein ALC57_18442 [Trachymyrmex cornetzi]|uniref:Endonuclease/exonuclease/phosphatase domain-containing protein n=1 Tax=Trachymyrmex cornetzi TaxID=471704 RepID=A0A151IRU4_9HYME|nr:hypothetical protein ALC57_18442 [Trachymyrmex cornetzi]
MREEIYYMKIEDAIDSDHHPLIVTLKGGRDRRRGGKEGRRKEISGQKEKQRRDEKENWTYTGGRGDSVIDYILMDKEMREEIYYMKIEDAIDSDHHPLIVTLKGGRDRRRGEGRGGKEACRGVWDEGEREVFRDLSEYLPCC